MPRQSTFSLPTSRAEQLRRIAECQGMTVGELLNNFIVAEWNRLGFGGKELPGFYISAFTLEANRWRSVQQLVEFRARPLGRVHLQLDQARMFAAGLVKAADNGESSEVIASKCRLRVTRQGRGLVLTLHDKDGAVYKMGMTPGVARDVAEALEQSADSADAKRNVATTR
jgi:hypothetical protein